MRLQDLFPFSFLSPTLHSPPQCIPSTFQALLPANARVAFTRSVAANSTFHVSPSLSGIAYPRSPENLPALCAVQVNVTSSPTSAYSFGLFLPDTGPGESIGRGTWNSRFLAVGNSGFSGGINYLDMAAGVRYGFASMSTDTGHNSTVPDVSWAYQNEERRIDFGWRALHGSVVLAKQIVEAYYGEPAKWSYFSGCSTGGRQGLKSAQQFPGDFDGILAGAPAWWTRRLQTRLIKLALYNLPVDAEWHIPPEKFELIGAEVLKQCDAQDGLRDGIIMDPGRCDFFAEALLCGAQEGQTDRKDCLTAAQISTLEKIYSDYVETNQTLMFPHLSLGSEAQWGFLLGSDKPSPLGYEYPQYMLDLGPDWDFNDYDYSVQQLADQKDPGNCSADAYSAMDAFHRRGGKLLMYHGYADGLIPAGSSTYFYKAVLRALGSQGIDLHPWFRYFLVPGMQHCSSTPPGVDAPWYFAGANQAGALGTGEVYSTRGFEDKEHDVLLALMEWTEGGIAPEKVVLTKWRDDQTREEVWKQRPVCAYPKRARYDGSDEPEKAESWRCEALY